jgi:tRNA pseudouridine55 synthase
LSRVGSRPEEASFGLLPVDKPAGPTSHDIVANARRSLGIRKIGHSGTLDPFASGLLLLAVGPATRLLEYLAPLDKEYVATARLGETTETLDPEGEPVFLSEMWQALAPEEVRETLASFLGDMDQEPPLFSAKKVGGEPAYRRARRGERVALDASPVTVHEIELLDLALPNVTFRVRCSTGTYIRSLARDLGERLETGAYLSALRRTGIGPFSVGDGIPPEELRDPGKVERAFISPRRALSHMPALHAEAPAFRRLAHGQSVHVGDLLAGSVPHAVGEGGDAMYPAPPPDPSTAPGPFVVYCDADDGRLVVAGWRTDEGEGERDGRPPTHHGPTPGRILRPLKVVGNG